MNDSIQLAPLLRVVKKNAGSNLRLANIIGVTEKTVAEWLKKTEEELRRLRQENIDAIIGAARKLGIEPACYEVGPPLWDISATYESNLTAEPLLPPHQVRPFRKHSTQFLGHEIDCPFGASASVMTSTSGRVRFLALTGSAVITYKTVRSRFYPSHPSPNVFYCDHSAAALDPRVRTVPSVLVGDSPGAFHPSHGMMNRFGMPCPVPEVWRADFAAARACLKPGQLLILSVVGTADQGAPEEELLEDFVRVVEIAVAARADVIELNLSCPNCSGLEGALYHNVPLVVKICKAVSYRVHNVKFILKIGFMRGQDLETFVLDTVPYVHGYCAINTVPVEGLREGQHGPEPAFGRPKLKAGLSGKPILRYGLACIRELVNLRDRENLKNIALIGVGGVTSPQEVKTYLDTGADVAQATTAFFADSFFGIKVRTFLDSELQGSALSAEEEVELARGNWSRAVTELEADGGDSTRVEQLALPIFLDWQREHARTASLGPRRGGSVPDVAYFKERIRASLAGR